MAENQLVSFSLVILAAVTFVGQAHEIDICEKANYVPLCRSVVKGATDAKIAIKPAIEHLLFETKRARSGSVVLVNKRAINTCNENYDLAIDSLVNSLEHLKNNDKTEVEAMLTAAISSYGSCSDAVGEYRTFGVVKLNAATKVTDTDTTLKHLASNCLHIASLLK